ncbi:pseudouridine synthase PUS5 NDAI_0G02300 [Naumovozyma dairenensis CBS 421]|uniref:21S rRNA pseudouridine(2819) synthase n=1 Tax=Naumovozyma dairenensis (strain ATCC 10597 / BCRC 20456 / CBS 421 / NBRC 0211 / NRRL Y-12639) TaxID=1071378 RepID=G0WDZ4_NAUDC|nr:hypothetical protein NDAI_0G02300 [Naumovozyma dairenensis CBS 421]CCD26005.2 hypothetical protein NDAI_0G02300 [Naumovozyma dairenensis CBS 421]
MIKIIFDCNNYIIVNKPFGVFSQPGDLGAWFLKNPNSKAGPRVLLDEVPNTFSRNVQSFDKLRTVNRLDACVTGGMLLAKNKNAAEMFSRNLRKGGNSGFQISRRYVALLDTNQIDDFQALRESGTMISDDMVSKYKRLDEQCILLELVTGKKHQLRKQLASILKQPILNDCKNGGLRIPEVDENQIALHSAFIKTKVGLQERKHLIPMTFDNNGNLWLRKYCDAKGHFSPEIIRLLDEGW